MRNHALVHEPSAHNSSDAQPEQAVQLLRRQGKKAVQIRVPEWFPVKVTREVRCYIFGHRFHHGLTGLGCVIVGTVLSRDRLVLLGTMLCLDDKEDWPWPMKKL